MTNIKKKHGKSKWQITKAWQPTPQAPSEIRWGGALKYDEAMVLFQSKQHRL